MVRRRRIRAERAAQYTSPGYRELQARLAANLLRLRAERGWTQEEAAARCDISTRLFQRLEGRENNATFTTLARVATGLKVDVVELLKPRGGRAGR